MRYRLNSDGTKTPIAGRGRAEYGASTVRTGTVTNVAVSVESTAVANITFTTAMPDANYLVNISGCNYGIPTFSITEKTTTGFKVVIYNPTTITLSDLSFNYTAFKLYTDTEYNKIIKDLSELIKTIEVTAPTTLNTPVKVYEDDTLFGHYVAVGAALLYPAAHRQLYEGGALTYIDVRADGVYLQMNQNVGSDQPALITLVKYA